MGYFNTKIPNGVTDTWSSKVKQNNNGNNNGSYFNTVIPLSPQQTVTNNSIFMKKVNAQVPLAAPLPNIVAKQAPITFWDKVNANTAADIAAIPALQQQETLQQQKDNATITNPFLKFLARTSQVAGNMATLGNGARAFVDTGNKATNFISDTLGSVGGAVVNPFGVGDSLYSGASKFVGNPIEKASTKLLSKTPNVVNKIGSSALGNFGSMAAINAGLTAGQGGNLQQIGNSALQGGLQGALFGTVLGGVKAGSEALNNGVNKLGIDNIIPKSDAIKPFNPITDTLSNKDINTPTNNLNPLKPSLSKSYTVQNTNLDKAQSEYDNAIDKIHNYFQTNKLTPQEVTRIQPELGINLNKLVNNIETAKTSASTIGDDVNLANAAGVTDLKHPSLVKTNVLPNNNLNPLGEVATTKTANASITQPPIAPNDASLNISPEEIRAQQLQEKRQNNNQYVNTSPIDINKGTSDKGTATDIRQSYTGKLNGQIVTGNQLRDNMQKLAPNEQAGIQLYLDAGGDTTHLQSMANNPDTQLDKFIPNTKTTYREAYNQALNLSDNAKKAVDMAKQYYDESGKYAFDLGTTNSILDNYSNRMWNKDQGNTASLGKSGLSTYTGHSQERVYNNIGEGILNGKEPSTLNAGDLLSIHNEEMARVNSNMELANSMKDNGIGSFVNGKAEPGFTPIDSLSQKIPTDNGTLTRTYQVPDGIAKGLKAITDPNYLKMWGGLNGIAKYQGVVKTVDLSYSLFHHITLASEMLTNNTGGLDMIRHLGDLTKLNTPEFNAMEQDFAKHTGMTTKVADNMDTLGKLSGNTTLVDKMTNIPVLKQLKQVSDWNTDLLFNKIQRWLKVTDYNNKVLDYVAKNPQTDNTTLTNVKRSLAAQVNNAYGGLNFSALGKTKTALGIERLALLAPDWSESSVRAFTRATGHEMINPSQGILQNAKNMIKGNPGVNAQRKEYLVGLGGGLLLTEGLNHILTGHFTDQNPKGHELEVEVQPGVYVSAFRSGMGDLTKLSSHIINNGVGGGIAQSLQAKLSPLARTAVGAFANKNYNGQQIYGNSKKTLPQNELNVASFLAQSAGPMPFGVGNIKNYSQDANANPLGGGLVGTGVASYAKDKTNPNNPSASYKDNYLNKWLNPSPDQSQINLMQQQKSTTLANSKAANTDIQNALKSGGDLNTIATKYNLSPKDLSTKVKTQQKQLDKFQQSPLQQQWNSMSKAQQIQFNQTNGTSLPVKK